MFCSIYTINFATVKLAANCFDVNNIFAFTFTILAISENLDKNISEIFMRMNLKVKLNIIFLHTLVQIVLPEY